ncbi:ribosomal protein L22 [Ceratobasidium sp. AG-I]|nr:ribosomal protein L22 [Ceratobasidium sp. AG-I]
MSRLASTSLAAVCRSAIRTSAVRVVPRATPPSCAAVTGRRGIVLPSFSDIFRGKFTPREEEAPSETAKQDDKEQQVQENTNLFDVAEKDIAAPRKVYEKHKYSTAVFKIARRKLNPLANQISGKPIDAAILQMAFSDKRAARRIKSTLCLARDHAEMYKGLPRDKLVVAEAWVSKGKYLKRSDPKGRGRVGWKHHPSARMSVVLKVGKTHAEILEKERKYKLGRIAGAGIVREDRPIRNPGPGWAW